MKVEKDKIIKVLIVILLAAAIGAVLYARNAARNKEGAQSQTELTSSSAALPKLVDLGATKCIPCKMMAPILEELKKDFAGRMDVVFIDVWENAEAGQTFGIKIIPTQIFYAEDGTELFRHEGFFSREDILAKWKELEYDFSASKEK